MPFQQHGGSYRYASINKQAGNTAVKDYCMAVGVMLAGSKASRWSDSDWPNARYDRSTPHLLVLAQVKGIEQGTEVIKTFL